MNRLKALLSLLKSFASVMYSWDSIYGPSSLHLVTSELKGWSKANRKNNVHLCQWQQHFSSTSANRSLVGFFSVLATHSPLFPSSPSLPGYFLFFLRPCEREWILFFKAVAAVRSAGEGGTERETEREALLFHHTRSLCSCQPPVGAPGMECMCWAYAGARYTSGIDWGSQWRAWNGEVVE